ncbi:helix-turn-helix domain-containing protein [Erysipelothrix sp. HDW6A]|uniref:LexA family protein n=1 Tax=Erysipelothrix sp. HDW6A TaxID=2714928 RepID=UPI001407DE3C|nr:S24 family peptidase [Erysipelothrix sp. HDW6A]QIK57156.1 helix-turn-helix domain-containing protein [Erysipelothrix sp. HDW6A]
MTLQEIITIYRERLGLSLEDISDAVAVSKSTVSRWENGIIKKISEDNKLKLSKLFNIDIDDYLQHRFFKPVLGTVRAGYNLLADEHVIGYEEVSKSDYDRGDYFLKVVGDSMTGSRIYDGDIVYIQKVSAVDSGSIAVILIEEDEVTIKRVIYKDKLMILEASNPEYETRYYNEEDVLNHKIQILGKVLKVKVDF